MATPVHYDDAGNPIVIKRDEEYVGEIWKLMANRQDAVKDSEMETTKGTFDFTLFMQQVHNAYVELHVCATVLESLLQDSQKIPPLDSVQVYRGTARQHGGATASVPVAVSSSGATSTPVPIKRSKLLGIARRWGEEREALRGRLESQHELLKGILLPLCKEGWLVKRHGLNWIIDFGQNSLFGPVDRLAPPKDDNFAIISHDEGSFNLHFANGMEWMALVLDGEQLELPLSTPSIVATTIQEQLIAAQLSLLSKDLFSKIIRKVEQDGSVSAKINSVRSFLLQKDHRQVTLELASRDASRQSSPRLSQLLREYLLTGGEQVHLEHLWRKDEQTQ